MPDLAITATITRTELSLADLSLNDGSNFKVMGAGPGGTAWKRQFAESPFMHGRQLIGATQDIKTAPLRVRVKGTTQSQVNSNLNSLLRALEQFSYNVTITIEGITYTWACEPADYTVDENDEFNRFVRLAKQVWVNAQIPRNPIPVAGVI